MNDDARCGSKPARLQYIFYFIKEWMCYEIPEKQARPGELPWPTLKLAIKYLFRLRIDL